MALQPAMTLPRRRRRSLLALPAAVWAFACGSQEGAPARPPTAATAEERCADGIDNDQDGRVDCADPGCDGHCPERCDDLRDNDGDTWVDCADPDCASLCDADGDGWVGPAYRGEDCDDTDPTTHPSAAEVCDGRDNDCDGLADDDDASLDRSTRPLWYVDHDLDGWGGSATTRACAPGAGFASMGGDCDDRDSTIHPDALERCGGVDEDCDGLLDDDDPDLDALTTQHAYVDADADTHGDPASPIDACVLPLDAVPYADDCDDTDPTLGPPTDWVMDDDRDGVGAGEVVATSVCAGPPGSVPVGRGMDCDDEDEDRHPGAQEVCEDGVDQDCSGEDGHCPARALPLEDDDARILGLERDDHIGGVVGTADTLGDGSVDLLIGQSDYLDDGAWLLRGPVEGDLHVDQATTRYDCVERCYGLGNLFLGAGDQDGDGLEDLAIGAGDVVWLASGTLTGDVLLDQQHFGRVSSPGVASYPAAGGADLTDDGVADLLLYQKYGTKHYLVAGPLVGQISAREEAIVIENPGSDGDGVAFPGDTDGDGRQDLLLSGTGGYLWTVAPTADTTTAAAHTTLVQRSSVVAGAGDHNGDGYDDLAMTGSEAVWLFHGPLPQGEVSVDEAALTLLWGPEIALGSSLAAGDTNADGYADLVVGSPRRLPSGGAYLVLGPAAGTSPLWAADLVLASSTEDGDAGAAVAVGDMDGDGLDDLIIGAPGHDGHHWDIGLVSLWSATSL